MEIELKSATRTYPVGRGKTVVALNQVDLVFPRGSFTVILGKSGCGKTTMLRLLAGLERPDGGSVVREHKSVVGMVFQEPRLMPWLSVLRNVELVLGDSGNKRERASACLDSVGLSSFLDAMPDQLSGGMAQRVALARAISFEPKILLMDEPFGALDYFTRKALQDELLSIVKTRGLTTVFVTHDVEEAISLASRIVIMESGRVLSVLDPIDGRSLSAQDREDLRDLILRSLENNTEGLSALSKGA